jgi:hypothetical protein
MPSLLRFPLRAAASAAVALAVALAPAAAAWAHRGPGFSAGARSVPGSETIARGRNVLTQLPTAHVEFTR